MGEAVWFVAQRVGGDVGTEAVLRLIVGTLVGVVVYLAVLVALGVPELDFLRRRFGRTVQSRLMIDRATRWWHSLTARVRGSSEAEADPKAQLEQAIVEAQHQHKRLKDQAASVIANQKQAEIRLNTKLGELEKLNRTARQALLMASDAQQSGDDVDGDPVRPRRRDHRRQADLRRGRRREPEDHGPRVDAGHRPGQGGGQDEQPAAAGEAGGEGRNS